MKLPNILTVSRIGLAFLFMLALFSHTGYGRFWALILFLLASLTDGLDGFLARRWNQTSAFGALMDPIADKVLVLAAFLSFVEIGIVPAWMVLLIFTREFLITGLRLVAVRQGKVLAAERGGKHKTVSQMVAIAVTLVYLIVLDFYKLRAPADALMRIEQWGTQIVLVLTAITVAMTLTSGVSFAWRHRKVLLGS
ncbi:MAG: CDP-diacylglycerol--glycerol-3-phosphate 3-phosphatidyltransferase [Candidatus Omnitrophica bacterium]|nr:CDP-diacylglycerol--glycerol-3-phosphate 3-phosphatidyltransferase [Candidatus Omnitrophota bacterium]